MGLPSTLHMVSKKLYGDDQQHMDKGSSASPCKCGGSNGMFQAYNPDPRDRVRSMHASSLPVNSMGQNQC